MVFTRKNGIFMGYVSFMEGTWFQKQKPFSLRCCAVQLGASYVDVPLMGTVNGHLWTHLVKMPESMVKSL